MECSKQADAQGQLKEFLRVEGDAVEKSTVTMLGCCGRWPRAYGIVTRAAGLSNKWDGTAGG